MSATDRKYLIIIGLHILLGFAHFAVKPISKVYAIAILVVGFYAIIKSRNKNQEVLYVCGYIVGAEVLLRMTGANILYEYGKYSVVFFIFLGTYYSGFSKNGVPYWLFLLLLVPGLLLATQTLGHDVEMRKTISFNISGPFCLGVCALYCYQREITQSQLFDMLKWMAFPIISATAYLVFATPDLKEAITGTGSNFVTSGGFGPNQVATVLGLGMFIFVSRIIFNSPNKLLLIVNLIISLNIAFRGLITFSRGGMITGIVILIALVFTAYFRLNSRGRGKITSIFVAAIVTFFGIWLYSSVVTGGLIEKRYANQDTAGRTKQSQFSGREEIVKSEVNAFLEHPFLGIGVAKGTELRVLSGTHAVSHNEITRMLAEHGIFGILGLFILLFTPMILYLDNKNHIFLFSFILFWLLTINHAAMRLAAPAFVYALSLLKITAYDEEQPVIHRQ